MGIFTNGVTANDETSRKRGLENGDFPVKFKRRKVSAIRDFPEGCGSFAPLLFDAKPIETPLGVVDCSTQSLEVGAEGVCVIVEGEKSLEVEAEGVSVIVEDEKVLINPSLECSVESGGDTELGKTSDTIESVKLEEGMNDDDEALKGMEIVEPVVMEIESGGDTELGKTSDTIESVKLEKGMNDDDEALKGMEIVEPVVMEILKDLDVVNDASPLITIEAESTNTLKNLDKVELLDSVKDFDGSESNSLLENGSQPAEIDLPESPMDADLPLTSNVLDKPQTSGLVSESIHKCYPPQRRVFVIRDFPPGCGRNAPELSNEERLKLINSTKNPSDENEDSTEENRQLDQMIEDDAREIRENVQDGNGFKRKPKGNVFKVRESFKNQSLGTENSIGKSRQLEQMVEGDDRKGRANVPDGGAFKSKLKGDDKEITHSGRSGKEPLKLSKDSSSFKSKLPDDSEDESLAIVQSQGEGLQPPSERVIVQALMAAPYCPWRQGKRGFKSPPPRGPTEGGKGKKHDMHGNSKFLPKKNDGKGNSEEKSAKRKMPPTGKDAYQCSDNQVIVWDEHDTPGHDENDESSGTTGGKRKKHHNRNEKKDGAGNSKENSTERKMFSVGKDAYEYINEQHVVRDEYDSPGHDDEDENFALVPRAQGGSLNLIPFGLHMFADKDDSSETIVTRNKVRETLRLFQAIFRKLLRDEEAKAKEQGNKFKRVDLISASILKEKNKWVNTGKPILGPVPGVEVGDEFHYRVEISIIGLHHPFQGGIDYLRKGNRIVATSIVASGGHDEMDSSDVLIYSGQGGNPVGKEKQAEDQKLERGNLALKNSMDESSPVRVIRGFKETKGADNVDTRAKVVATYIYDGLYLVERYWQEKGRYGANVFMFRLRRIPGQPELAFKEVKKLKKLRVGICVDDISQGKEKMPICAINTIDDEKPPPFKYITSMIYPSWYKPMPPKGCECTNGCSDSEKCLCAVKNGGEILFNYNGAIVEAKSLVYECGPLCKCPPSCHNRVSQHGIKFQLEIFKTELRGWGVRSLTSIPSGSFICEYTGELLEDKEAEKRTGNDEYLFDIGNNYNDGTLWDGLSSLIPPDLQSSSSCETVEDVGFTIDALKYGSVGRFINHSCSPNLYAQNVVYDHDDKRMPHIMLFAAENIPPLQELTYHYNYVLDQVLDSDGNIKKKKCYCGSHACSGRLY